MEPTNGLLATPAVKGSSCHSTDRSVSGVFAKRRGVMIAIVAVAALGLALAQHWLTVAALTPLLFVLPCFLMMLMCMKQHGGDSQPTQGAATVKTPGSDTPMG